MKYNFNFSRKQLEEFIYDLRKDVTVHYVAVILKLVPDFGAVICTVLPNRMDMMVREIRTNHAKTVDEFIRDYNTPSSQSTRGSVQAVIEYFHMGFISFSSARAYFNTHR